MDMSELASSFSASVPTRAVRLGRPRVAVDRRADGTIYLRAADTLPAYPDKLTARLEYWAERAPDRILFAQRDAGGGWRSVTYSQALTSVRSIGEALLRRGLSAERPIVILSGNDIEHALFGLAANMIGVPYAPISPAYSLVSNDMAKLRHIFGLLTPGLVFIGDGTPFARAVEMVVPPDVEIVVARGAIPGRPCTEFPSLLRVAATGAVDTAHGRVGPHTIAKFLFTSGSTGMPKAVVNTQRMWCANQVMMLTALAFFEDEPPVIVDWAPWHHTAGGNHNVGLVIHNGGTLYIDEGKPLPGAIEATVGNLREIAPNWYFNVPKGFEALLPYLRSDAQLRRTFFSRLKVLWYAGAGIGQHVFDELKELAIKTCGERVLFLTGLGATETAPYAFGRMWDTEAANNIGLPPPGLEVKLVPAFGKLEARLRGPSIMPGYWRSPDLSADAFDDEGFYRLGDAFQFADPNDPQQGLLYQGRISEDFKLSSGTWVSVGLMRATLLEHLAPLARDAVLAGANRDDITALVFPDIDACRALTPLTADAAASEVLSHPAVRAEFQRRLQTHCKTSTGSSTRVCRVLLLETAASLDLGEITDKGSINQRAVLQHRAGLVEDLYANPLPPHVIVAAD
jgi:feruloyl-CoA synthase